MAGISGIRILESNNLLIAAERLARAQGDVILAGARAEKEMRRDPLKVEIVIPAKKGQGGRERAEKVAVIPDAWVDLRYGGSQRCIAFELDRGTQAIDAIQRKCYGYLTAFEGGYQEKFGTSSITVAFVAVRKGWSRAEQLRSWTEQALSLKGSQAHADLFGFSSFDALATDPAEIFLSPLWLRPFTEGAAPLLERE